MSERKGLGIMMESVEVEHGFEERAMLTHRSEGWTLVVVFRRIARDLAEVSYDCDCTRDADDC